MEEQQDHGEETPQGTGQAEAEATTEAPPAPEPVEPPADEKFKQHARTWEKRAKESHAKVEELEAKLSELAEARDMAVTERDEALAEKAGIETALTRYRIGRELGLPDLLCERLQGDSEEALREDAEQVAKLLGRSTVDLTKLSGGFEPNTPPKIDPAKIVDNMPNF